MIPGISISAVLICLVLVFEFMLALTSKVLLILLLLSLLLHLLLLLIMLLVLALVVATAVALTLSLSSVSMVSSAFLLLYCRQPKSIQNIYHMQLCIHLEHSRSNFCFSNTVGNAVKQVQCLQYITIVHRRTFFFRLLVTLLCIYLHVLVSRSVQTIFYIASYILACFDESFLL